ncbi:MAG: hypothetical protein R3E18_01555 [Sphingomonadaceae bacterium]
MSMRTTLLTASFLLLIFGAAGFAIWQEVKKSQSPAGGESYEPDVHLTASDMSALQDLATQSCRCEQQAAPDNASDCWRAYKEETAAFKVSTSGTACAPIATTMDCFATDEGEKCITTAYDVVILGGATVCSQNEARFVEAAINAGEEAKRKELGKESAETDQAVFQAGIAAAERAVRRIENGQPTPDTPPTNGCAG